MQTQFRVPVLPYVKKYLIKKFFAGDQGPHKIEEDTLIGKQFMSVIIDARKKDVIDRHIEFSETLEVVLSQDMLLRSPKVAKLITINYFLDKVFKEELIAWILSAQHYGIRPFPASKDFLEYYGIEECEYSHDAAYKIWTRWKNRDYGKKKSQRRPKIKSPASVV